MYESLLQERLTQKRYLHSVNVAAEAVRLAEKYGADPQKAYTAGLLHDISKNLSNDETLIFFEEFDIMLDSVSKKESKLWHAIAGESYVRHVLGISDEEILSAIRYHTTARSRMSLLEKIIYIADFTSAERDYPDVDNMRKCADISVESSMIYALSYTIADLVHRSKLIHPDTISAYNEQLLLKKDDS